MTRSSSRTLPGQSIGHRAHRTPPTDSCSGRSAWCRPEEVARQLRDVLAPRAQRRHLDVDAAQPVEQIEPELAARSTSADERPVGGDDDADVDRPGADAADPLDRQVLDRAQQLGLRRRRQVRHLVEEQRAVVRVLELAAAAAHAGRRAILDPEQLRFEQRLDDRRAVDGDERPLAPAAEVVNLPRHELLARARFALDQNREIASRRASRCGRAPGGSPGSSRSAAPRRRAGCARTAAAGRQRPLHLEHQRRDMRRRLEQLARPAVERPPRIEDHLDSRGLRQHEADGISNAHHVAAGTVSPAARRRPPPPAPAPSLAAPARTAPASTASRAGAQRTDDRLQQRRRAAPAFRSSTLCLSRSSRDVQDFTHRVTSSLRPLDERPYQGRVPGSRTAGSCSQATICWMLRTAVRLGSATPALGNACRSSGFAGHSSGHRYP